MKPNGQVLYRKWRPQTFADFVGQDHVKQTIINSIKAGKVSHAYLFAGPRGTGKTSMARLLAKAVNCLEPAQGEPCGKCRNCQALVSNNLVDLLEIDAASHTGVDDVRELIEKVNFAPAVGRYKVYIIDEVHMLSKNAFNALLKTLEEPPPHVIFILATTEVHKLLPTVISRCQYFDFHHLSWDEITTQLKKIADQEKISITADALSVIAENAEGSLRDAISIMDQAVDLGAKTINRSVLEKLLGIVDNTVVREMTQAVLDNDTVRGINLVNQAYFKGYDIQQLSKRWLNYLRELLMIRLGNEALVERSGDEKKKMKTQSDQMNLNGLINLLQRLVEAINSYKVASQPQLALEMVIVRCVNDATLTKATAVPVPKPARSTDQSQSVKPKPQVQSQTATSPSGHQVEPKQWQQLCTKVAETSPALAALMKNSQAQLVGDKLVIEAPSDFLKQAISKSSNLRTIIAGAGEVGVEVEKVECIVSGNQTKAVDEVAGVFDIM